MPWELDEIGIQGNYTIQEIPQIDSKKLSVYLNSQLYSSTKQKRANLSIQSQIDHGSYGNVYMAKRDGLPILLKQPRMVEMNLLQEAVLQHLAHTVLKSEGIPSAIPKVYDVFWKGNEIWFSMEHISGTSVEDWFAQTKTPDTDTFFLLAQISCILGVLEAHLNLDHRDLKASNLLLKKESCSFRIKLKDKIWTLKSPFTVVVLDFGFACLGSEVLNGKPYVNLGDGVLPPMDPCPKEGRDIFHLLVSLLGLPVFRDTISKRLHEKIDAWLSVGKKSYGQMARRWSTENWSYLVSSQPSFSIRSCCPLSILQDILPELRGFLSCA